MRRLLVPILLAAALAGCARTSGTVEIPPEELPFPIARTPSPTETVAPARRSIVYFIRDGRLVVVARDVPSDGPPVEGSLRALLEGPSRSDLRARIQTEISADVRLLEILVDGSTAHVDLSGEFQQPASPDRVALRVAQVVWTATEIPGVTAVTFAIDGEPVEIATGDGTVVGRAVNRSDYLAFAPG